MKLFSKPAVLAAVLAGSALSASLVTVAIADVLWDTGKNRYCVFNGANSYLGFSSGNVSATLPQRWLAQPFDLAAAATLTQIEQYGFEVGGAEFSDVVIKIWNRPADDVNGDPVPPTALDQVGGDIVVPQGVNPFGWVDPNLPVDAATNPGWTWRWPVSIPLGAGRYYLTIYAGTPELAGGFSNLAWFCNGTAGTPTVCNDGIAFVNTGTVVGLPGGNPPPYPYMFRSATFPVPGLRPYDVSSTVLSQDPFYVLDPNDPCFSTVDLNDLYVAVFKLDGTPGDPCGSCPDFDGDGSVDLDDLTEFLGSFGTDPANDCLDIDGDGLVDLDDLTAFLGAFGTTC